MLTVLKSYCPWKEEEIICKNIPHALSNEVYQVTHKESNDMVLVRVYLNQDRTTSLDLTIAKELGDLGLGPKVLSTCQEGSVEEWIKGRTMSHNEMLSPEYMDKLAVAIKTLHNAKITHNDLHHNNFMIEETNDGVRLIDFEYAKYNATDVEISFDLANHFCEWMYNYNSENWHVPHPLGETFDPLAERFLTSYYHPLDIPEGCLEAILAQQFQVHKRWVQWGLDYFDHTQEAKYLTYAVARARLDPEVMAVFSKETRWLAHL